jgi:hypothetical protein
MDERLRFVARLLEGEKMAPLCAEFGISRERHATSRSVGMQSLFDRFDGIFERDFSATVPRRRYRWCQQTSVFGARRSVTAGVRT